MGQSFDDVLHYLLLILLDNILSKKVDVRDLEPDFELDTKAQSSSPSTTSAIEDDIMLVLLLRN